MSVQEASAGLPEVGNAEQLHHSYGRFDRADKGYLAASFAIAVVIAVYTSSGVFGFFIAIAAVGGLPLYRLSNGRIYHTFVVGLVGLRMKIINKDVPYKAETDSRLAGLLQPRGDPVPLQINDVNRVALAYNRHEGTDGIVIEVEGSDIPNRSPWGQFHAHTQIADTMKKVTAMMNTGLEFSMVLTKRPQDRQAAAAVVNRTQHPEVLYPAAYLKPQEEWSDFDVRMHRGNRLSRQLLDMVAEKTYQVSSVFICNLRRDPKLDASAKKGKGLELRDIERLPITTVKDTMIGGLSNAGLYNPKAMDRLRMHRYLRGWDVAFRDEYDEACSRHGNDFQALEEEASHHPSDEIVVQDKRCCIDGTWHTTLRLKTNSPRLLPYSLSQLFSLPAPYFSVALVGSTIKSNREYGWLNSIRLLSETIAEKLGIDTSDPKSMRREEARIERQLEIFLSNFSMDYAVFIGVCHPDEEALDRYAESIRNTINAMPRMTCEYIRGRGRVVPAALTASTGFNLL
jgi:hypothetical protein